MTELVRLIGLRFLLHSSGARSNILITAFSVCGMAIGVAAIVSVLSVMDGFMSKMRKNVLSFSGHANIYKLIDDFKDYEETMEIVRKVEGVKGVTPVVFREAMISFGDDITGIMVSGIDRKTIEEVISLSKFMKKGSVKCMKEPEKCGIKPPVPDEAEKARAELFGEKNEIAGTIIIGSDMASSFDVDKGDVMTIISPTGGSDVKGEYNPVSGMFLVAGIFESGMYEYDSKTIFMDIDDAQNFFRMKREVSYLSVKTSDMYEIEKTTERILEKLQGFPYSLQNWKELNRITFKFLETQKVVMFIILGFIILVASFGIISTLIMLVMRKKEEISVLRAIGASRSTIMKIFIFDGLLLGLSGTTAGMILGVMVCFLLKEINFPLAKDVYFFSTLPVEMSPLSFLIVGLSAVFISFAATLYPSWQASRLDPAEGIRYD